MEQGNPKQKYPFSNKQTCFLHEQHEIQISFSSHSLHLSAWLKQNLFNINNFITPYTVITRKFLSIVVLKIMPQIWCSYEGGMYVSLFQGHVA